MLKKNLVPILTLVGFFLLSFFAFRLVLPFFLAFFTVSLTSSLAKRLKGYTAASEKALRLFFLAMLLGILVFGSILITRLLFSEAEGFFTLLFDTLSASLKALTTLWESLRERFHLGSVLSADDLSSLFSAFLDRIAASLSSGVASFVTRFVKTLPSFLFAFVFYLLSLVYIALDYESVKNALVFLIPSPIRPILIRLKKASVSLVTSTLRAYGILFLITFVVLTLAFFFMKIAYPVWWAILTATLDALPAIGIGIILLPWAFALFVGGNTVRGALMLLLYLALTLLRQFLEPRILGRALGVRPIVSLLSLYLSLKLFGALGLLAAPFLSVFFTRIFTHLSQQCQERTSL